MNRLYNLTVTHVRTRPRQHQFTYAVPYLLLDLAHPPVLRLFSWGRWNLTSFYEADHGDGIGPLKNWVEAQLENAGIKDGAARIMLLTMPRFLGFGFNPLSLFFCYAPEGHLRAVIYEVNNTFGQRHFYLCPVGQGDTSIIRQGVDKIFYVSPFMEMAQRYRFTLQPPGHSMSLHITVEDKAGVILHAAMAGKAHPLSDSALLKMTALQPWLGFKIITAIHWQAFKIWRKGISLYPRPAPPKQNVSQGYMRPGNKHD